MVEGNRFAECPLRNRTFAGQLFPLSAACTIISGQHATWPMLADKREQSHLDLSTVIPEDIAPFCLLVYSLKLSTLILCCLLLCRQTKTEIKANSFAMISRDNVEPSLNWRSFMFTDCCPVLLFDITQWWKSTEIRRSAPAIYKDKSRADRENTNPSCGEWGENPG